MGGGSRPTGFDIWGVPFDAESSLGWPGSRYAPDRVRANMAWINMRIQNGQVFDIQHDAIRSVGDNLLRDMGNVEIAHADTPLTFERVSAAVASSLSQGRAPIVIGGDDSLLFPVAKGIHDALPGTIGIVHFDAHLDLLDSSDSQGKLSQSSGMRRALELDRISPLHCIQVCERNFNFPSSSTFKRVSGLKHISARTVLKLGVDRVMETILERIGDADHVFLSLDIDCIDPAFAPGAGAHEPGGISSAWALEFVELLAPLCTAMAITEVNPLIDHRDQTSVLAAYLAFTFAVAGGSEPIGSNASARETSLAR